MWCVPALTPEFVARMEHILDLYEKPYDPKEPLVCLDEKSKQLIENTRPSQSAKPHQTKRNDYEYKRNGTRNLFVAVEPLAGFRKVTVTKRRTAKDFAKEIRTLVDLPRYRNITTLHIVLDNLNTHFEKSITETFSEEEAQRILSKIQFHYTPKHASWLDMAEIEIGVLDRQCIKGRIPTERALRKKVRVWSRERNKQKKTIKWSFTSKKAREKFKYSVREKVEQN